jgi:outer membrane protein OmpU
MKKVLLASTALALSAGVAAADVRLSGDARMGLQYNSANAVSTTIEKRFTLNIDGSTTTDGGVTLGARLRIRSDENTGSSTNGARVFARFGGLTVAAGNILGAIESMPNLYGPVTPLQMTGNGFHSMITNVDRGAGPGAIGTGGVNQFGWDSYSSRGNAGTASGDGIEVIYTMGDFTFHASYSADSLRGVAGGGNVRAAAYGAYKFSGWTLAVGIQDSNVVADEQEDILAATISGKVGNFDVGLGYAQNGKGANKVDKVALNVGVTLDNGLGLVAHVANQNFSGAGVTNPTTFGIGARYGLGGGAFISGGIQTTERGATRADLGLSFNF